MLITLQFIIASLSVRSKWVESVVKSEPILLFYQGQFLWQAMQSERVTQEEIESTVRQHGAATLNAKEAVILENDGSFSVIQDRAHENMSSLRSVKFPDTVRRVNADG